ncbi:hypothetical protein Micbo1qcDRAFT_167157, partial [Microdochium bolleyi]
MFTVSKEWYGGSAQEAGSGFTLLQKLLLRSRQNSDGRRLAVNVCSVCAQPSLSGQTNCWVKDDAALSCVHYSVVAAWGSECLEASAENHMVQHAGRRRLLQPGRIASIVVAWRMCRDPRPLSCRDEQLPLAVSCCSWRLGCGKILAGVWQTGPCPNSRGLGRRSDGAALRDGVEGSWGFRETWSR